MQIYGTAHLPDGFVRSVHESPLCQRDERPRGRRQHIYSKKYGVRIYPTFLLLRPDGSLYAKLEGGATKQAAKFIKRVEEALQLGAMEERYEAGERDIKLLTDYVNALHRPAPGKARAVISDYMVTLSAEEIADPDILCLIGQLGDMDCPGFAHLMDNRKA